MPLTTGKRFALTLFLSLLFFGGCLFYIYKGNLRTGLKLRLEVEASGQSFLRLYVDRARPVKALLVPGDSVQEVEFLLPKKKVKHLRLMVGEKEGILSIRNIAIKGPLVHSRLPGCDIEPLVRFPSAGVTSETKEGRLVVTATRPHPVIGFSRELTGQINRLGSQKHPAIVVALALSLLFFYFVYNLDPRNWRLFISPRAAVNMALVFLMVICLPLVEKLSGFSRLFQIQHLQEKRTIAKKPGFRLDSISPFLKRFQHYYNDHFSFRKVLIPLQNYIKVRYLAVSPHAKTILGKEDWLFMGRQNDMIDETEYYRGIRPFTRGELEQWRKTLEERRDRLAAKGIGYLFVVAPNKSTIYPEFMPARFKKTGAPSRLDQLLAHMGRHSDLPVLDLRSLFIEAKNERRVYRKADSHWNEYGAYLAYREILLALSERFPGMSPIPLSRFQIEQKPHSGGDLAILIQLQNNLYREQVFTLAPDPPLTARPGKPLKEKFPRVSSSVIECPGGDLGTALMVHDSFAHRLKPYLSEHFKRIVYLRDWGMNFYPGLIEKEKPVVVIDQTTERFLMGLVPANSRKSRIYSNDF